MQYYSSMTTLKLDFVKYSDSESIVDALTLQPI